MRITILSSNFGPLARHAGTPLSVANAQDLIKAAARRKDGIKVKIQAENDAAIVTFSERLDYGDSIKQWIADRAPRGGAWAALAAGC